MIRFAAPFLSRKERSLRKRGDRSQIRRGFFVDASTLASALFAKRFKLESLCIHLRITEGKLETTGHGGPLTSEYVAYAVRDTEATWACHAELLKRFDALNLPTPVHEVYSEASIGKAYLSAMRIQPWRKMQPDAPPAILATILSTYFGGRSEVRIRRQLARVVLCDFLSMYPTVGVLQGLWRFVTANGMSWRECTSETQGFLDGITLAGLQDPVIWPRLTALVQIASDRDVVPVRAQYADEGATTIGVNHLLAKDGLWFTLADCVASKLLTGRAPTVLKALMFEPGEPQTGLRPVEISGKRDYAVDPNHDDFFKRVIELRHDLKRRKSGVEGLQLDALDAEELNLKIVANATSYGAFVQVNVREKATKLHVDVHHTAGNSFEVLTLNEEAPGPFFHPLLATLITGAARLMLAITERLVLDQGLAWAFCDTDSMAIAKPTEMGDAVFLARVGEVVGWFAGLNPYNFGGSILKVEDENFRLGDKGCHEPLYVWAVSAKRYALFNSVTGDLPVLRKFSAHGLGHLIAPYDETNPTSSVPRPQMNLAKNGVTLWQHDLWYQVIRAALDGHPDQVDLTYHPFLARSAVSRYAATTTKLLSWFKRANEGLPYRDQVKPFGFMYSLFADPFASIHGDEPGWGNTRRRAAPRPTALFDRDLQRAIETAFDRETGERIFPDQLVSYRTNLAQYHLHSEAKFLNGSYIDRGTTLRRTVCVDQIQAIGKEANRLEEQFYLGLDEEALVAYPRSSGSPNFRADLVSMSAALGQRELALRLGVPRATLSRLLSGSSVRLGKRKLEVLGRLVLDLLKESADTDISYQRMRAQTCALIETLGLKQAAAMLEIDPSNLAKVSKGIRPPSAAVSARLNSMSVN